MSTKTKRDADYLSDRELDLKNLEAYLLNTLGPVKPRQEFVQGLRGRLEHSTYPQANKQNSIRVKAVPQRGSNAIFLFLAGLAASLVLLITGIKATLSIVEAIKSLRQDNHQSGSNLARNRSASLIKSASAGN